MAPSVEFLDSRVIRVFMREEKGGFYLAAVRVFPFLGKDFFV